MSRAALDTKFFLTAFCVSYRMPIVIVKVEVKLSPVATVTTIKEEAEDIADRAGTGLVQIKKEKAEVTDLSFGESSVVNISKW